MARSVFWRYGFIFGDCFSIKKYFHLFFIYFNSGYFTKISLWPAYGHCLTNFFTFQFIIFTFNSVNCNWYCMKLWVVFVMKIVLSKNMPQLNLALMNYIINWIFLLCFLNQVSANLFLLDDDLVVYNKIIIC